MTRWHPATDFDRYPPVEPWPGWVRVLTMFGLNLLGWAFFMVAAGAPILMILAYGRPA